MENVDFEYRAEIICNQSVQDDVIDYLEQELPELEYSILPEVQGKGAKSKKLGNTTWPEKNFILFAYTNLDGAKKIKEILKNLKRKFPEEGISVFFLKSETI